MSPLLDSAATWFLDSATQERDGTLVIRLTEGLKGDERQFVEHDGQQLGPYFPVEVQAASRCVAVTFPKARACFSFDESLDTPDPAFERGLGQFLFPATDSTFRRFAVSRTLLAQEDDDALEEYFLQCEDRLFQVISEAPEVRVLPEAPRLDVERTQTWFAN